MEIPRHFGKKNERKISKIQEMGITQVIITVWCNILCLDNFSFYYFGILCCPFMFK